MGAWGQPMMVRWFLFWCRSCLGLINWLIIVVSWRLRWNVYKKFIPFDFLLGQREYILIVISYRFRLCLRSRFLRLLDELVLIFSDERGEAPNRLALHLYWCVRLLLRMIYLHNWCCIIAHPIGFLLVILNCRRGSNWFITQGLWIRRCHVRLTDGLSIDTAFNSLVLFTFPRVGFGLLDLKNFRLHLVLFYFHFLQVFSMVVSRNRLRENTVEDSSHLTAVLMDTVSSNRHYFKN